MLLKLFDVVPGWVYAIALGLAIGWLGVQEVRISSLQGDLSELKLAVAQAESKALREKADVEDKWRRKLEDSSKVYDAEIDALRIDLSRLPGVQPAVDSYVAKARHSCPQLRGEDQPRGDPIGVLAHVLSRESKAADLYAEVADRRRVTAARCERDYDALTSVNP